MSFSIGFGIGKKSMRINPGAAMERLAGPDRDNLQRARLVVDPLTPQTLYAGSWEGVFKSVDGGASWVNLGLTDTFIQCLVLDPLNPQTLYAGTQNGVYALTLEPTPSTAVEQLSAALPTAYALEQNYPNPFNPSTVIRFALPERGKVNLVVYNLLGQAVARLVEEVREAGIYTVSWDGRDDHGQAPLCAYII